MNLIEAIRKLPNENYYQYIWRLDGLVRSGQIPGWEKISPYVNKELFGEEETNYRTESAFRKPVKYVRDFVNAGVLSVYSEDKYLQELRSQERELEKARKKLQTEKLEYSKWLREEARDEMIMEKICESITSLSPLDIPKELPTTNTTREKAYCLVWGDEHFGTEFEIKDLFGNIINSYSPEIFEQRMWNMLAQTIQIIQKEGITELHAYSMGDFVDGCIRISQLMKLRYGVVDGTIRYDNFISNWLNELTKYTKVIYQMTDGNHSELRELGQVKGTFTEDNMGKVVKEFIKIRLADNPNFIFKDNGTGYIYDELAGNTVFGFHGETKNMERAIKDFSTVYNVQIQYLLAGHLHHSKTEEVGINSEVINIPSIVGPDTYSLSLNKLSSSAAKLLVFEWDLGKTCEYTLKP